MTTESLIRTATQGPAEEIYTVSERRRQGLDSSSRIEHYPPRPVFVADPNIQGVQLSFRIEQIEK